MLKKDTVGTASAASLSEAFRCGECLHHKNKAHSAKGQPCTLLGVRAVAVAPSCFTPDVTRIAKNSDQFVQLSALFNGYTHKEKRIMLGLLRAQTKKRQFTFGQKLYFKIGREFLNNYLFGFVMGYTSSGEIIVAGSPDRKTRGDSMLCYFTDDEGLLTASDWKIKRKELIDAKKVEDPKSHEVRPVSSIDTYEPPSLDSAPQSWHDKREAKPKRRRTDAVDTGLTSFNF